MKTFYVLPLALLLASCAYNDHSRNFTQNVTPDSTSNAFVTTTVDLEKAGTESSDAKNNPEIPTTLSVIP